MRRGDDRLVPPPFAEWLLRAVVGSDPEGLSIGSISNESTFAADASDRQAIADRLRSLTERVCWRARRRNVVARTITLKLRYSDFETLTRSRTIDATSSERVVLRCVRDLFRTAYVSRRRVRLLGVALSNLAAGQGQLELPFADGDRGEVGPAIDVVRDRFGYDAIRLGLGAAPAKRGRS